MPLFWFSLAVVIGIGISPIIHISHNYFWMLIIASCFTCFFELRRSQYRSNFFINKPLFRIPISLLFLGLILGMFRFSSELPNKNMDDIAAYTNEPSALVTGIVNSDPHRVNHYKEIIIQCEKIEVDGKSYKIKGKLSALIPSGYEMEYGDKVKLRGDIESTVGNDPFPISSRKGRQLVFAEMAFPEITILDHFQGNPILLSLYRFRNWANTILFDMVPFPESAVLSGILLGLDSSIPDYLWDGYRASGTAHIIVISGFNISLIAYLISKLFQKLWKYNISIPITIGAIILFTLFVGADQPVVRAAIMAIIAIPAPYFGRRAIGIYNLTLAAAIMLLINPFQLWDISFQLSFLATLSLLIVVDPLVNWTMKIINRNQSDENKDRFKSIVELLVSTLSASFVVFPILFKMTGTVSLVSLVANSIIVPLQPFIMILGSLAILLGSISPAIGGIFAKITWPFIALCNQIALRLSVHPAATKFLPGYVYWVSLISVIILLLFASIHQVAQLSKPNIEDK